MFLGIISRAQNLEELFLPPLNPGLIKTFYAREV
jgi:hypothetical protein